MTLATHIAIATAVAGPFARIHPAAAFFAAVASHYLADAIPHWDYSLRSMPDGGNSHNKKWVFTRAALKKDIFHTGLDGLFGILLVSIFTRPSSWPELLAAGCIIIGAILPDVLQGVYYTKKADFLKPLQKLHDYTHSEIKLSPYPLIGIPFQLLILFISILFF